MMTENAMEGVVAKAAAPSGRIMDDELYERLNSIFNSSDKDNWIIGENIFLSVTDPMHVDNIYNVWRFLRSYTYRLNRRRKAIREMLQLTWTIIGKSEYAFGEYLIREGKLTPEIWERIGPGIKDLQERKCKNPFFDIELKLKAL